MAAVDKPTYLNYSAGSNEDETKPRQKPEKLEDQAATAALYVSRHEKSNKTGQEFLDKDHRLSSAGR